MTSSCRYLVRASAETTIATFTGPGELLIQHAGLEEEEYVRRLNQLIEQKHLEKQAGGTPVDWANESHMQARQLLDPMPRIVDEAYYRANIELVNERLALAGLRLAKLLNDTLRKSPSASPSSFQRMDGRFLPTAKRKDQLQRDFRKSKNQ